MYKTKWKQIVLTFILAFGIAFVFNWAVLKLFGQKSAYRAEHSLVGIILLIAYVSLFVDKKENKFSPVIFFLLAIIPCYLGTVFPDLDITLFGIGGHRNPLFHSCISYFILFFIVFLFAGHKSRFIQTLVIGYGIGLASHLWWDVFDYGDVRWLPGGLIDRLWLGTNGLLSFYPLKAKETPESLI